MLRSNTTTVRPATAMATTVHPSQRPRKLRRSESPVMPSCRSWSEDEIGGADQAAKRRQMVPAKRLAKIHRREAGEDHQRDDFLDGLELAGVKPATPTPVCRHPH